MLVTQMNDMVRSGELRTGCVVQLMDFMISNVRDRQVAIVLSINILAVPPSSAGEGGGESYTAQPGAPLGPENRDSEDPQLPTQVRLTPKQLKHIFKAMGRQGECKAELIDVGGNYEAPSSSERAETSAADCHEDVLKRLQPDEIAAKAFKKVMKVMKTCIRQAQDEAEGEAERENAALQTLEMGLGAPGAPDIPQAILEETILMSIQHYEHMVGDLDHQVRDGAEQNIAAERRAREEDKMAKAYAAASRQSTARAAAHQRRVGELRQRAAMLRRQLKLKRKRLDELQTSRSKSSGFL